MRVAIATSMKLGALTWATAMLLAIGHASARDPDASAVPAPHDALAPVDPTVPAPTQGSDSGVSTETQAVTPVGPQESLVPALAPPELTQPRYREVHHWYGYQTLAVDGIALAIAFAGF